MTVFLYVCVCVILLLVLNGLLIATVFHFFIQLFSYRIIRLVLTFVLLTYFIFDIYFIC